ncbi:hypothetical protein, partial [Mycobacterium sp. 852013-50091_SCH5140682]|uniref:hypothetical protein n=1 Tax=Mycobacterium sp. 852013-50091_SCH5140682 TaxID=1834109 RepID=UPI001E527514
NTARTASRSITVFASMFEFYRDRPTRQPVIHNPHFIHRPYAATGFPDAQKSLVWLDRHDFADADRQTFTRS